jgi:nucleoside-diphosphate-sugar epimerase
MEVRPLKILVLGGSGFIGRRAVDALRDRSPGVNLTVWSRTEHGDLLDPMAVRRGLRVVKPECVLNLAWASTAARDYRDDPENERWVDASASLVDETQRQGLRLVLTGSALDDAASEEEDSPYGRAKNELRNLVAPLVSRGELTWLRPHYVISVAERRPNILRDFMNSSPSSPFHPLTPDASHDFIDVLDVGSAIAAVVAEGLTGQVEIGSGRLRSVDEVLVAVSQLCGIGYSSEGALPATQHRRGANVERLVTTGWRPTFTDSLFSQIGRGMNS